MREATDRPNIILVNCDDLGWGDLACYGSKLHDTPYLDRMAKEGTRFTEFYQGSSVCSPSRGGMLTGCYPRRIGFDRFEGKWVLFPGQAVGLNPTEVTFARLLQKDGYATKAIGKWHCGDQREFLPCSHGFGEYYGIPYSNDMGRQVRRENSPPLPLLRGQEVIEQQPDQASLTFRYAEEAVRFLRQNQERPFLLYLAHMYVHLPIYVPDRFARESRNGRYGGAVAFVDWVMGVLMEELKALSIERNTLVLFTSDNGSRCEHGPSNGPMKGTKASIWDGGWKLPLIAWWPGVVPAGRTCNELLGGMDLLPTFASIAGAKMPDDRIIDGKDVSGVLRGEAHSPREEFFYYGGDYLDALRWRNWKLRVGQHMWSENCDKVCELYDLARDVGESCDVASANPGVVKRMMAMMQACRDDMGDSSVKAAGANCRPIGRVRDPRPLTQYDPARPYYQAMYDLDEIG